MMIINRITIKYEKTHKNNKEKAQSLKHIEMCGLKFVFKLKIELKTGQ